jgi:hypothetical protein
MTVLRPRHQSFPCAGREGMGSRGRYPLVSAVVEHGERHVREGPLLLRSDPAKSRLRRRRELSSSSSSSSSSRTIHQRDDAEGSAARLVGRRRGGRVLHPACRRSRWLQPTSAVRLSVKPTEGNDPFPGGRRQVRCRRQKDGCVVTASKRSKHKRTRTYGNRPAADAAETPSRPPTVVVQPCLCSFPHTVRSSSLIISANSSDT